MLATTQGWVALMENRSAGFLLAQMTEGEVDILTFCVRPVHRKQGVGESLLRQVLKSVSSRATIHLEVAADNQAARGLYERCGFNQIGVRKGYYRRGKDFVDALSYQRIGSLGK